jgi:hypothetical protein
MMADAQRASKRRRRERGPSVMDSDDEGLALYQLVPKSEKTYDKVKEDVERKIFRVADRAHCFCYANDTPWGAEVRSQGKVKDATGELSYFEPDGANGWSARPFHKRWIADERLRTVRSVICDPGRTVEGVHNIWRGFRVEGLPEVPEAEVESLSAVIREHILRMYADGRQAVADRVLDWLAALFQRPGRKTQLGLVLHGKCFWDWGKETLFIWLRQELLGEYCTLCGPQLFTDPYCGMILVTMESKRRVPASIKQLITSPEIRCRLKFSKTQMAPNHVNLVVFTNDQTGGRAESGDSDPRLAVLNCSAEDFGEAYYNALAHAMEDPRVQRAFYQSLLKRDLSAYEADDAFPLAFRGALAEAVV